MAGVKRDAQRRRTRRAIVEATADLLERGEDALGSEIAAAADVSRRTVYMYFPSVEQLHADAALEAARGTIEPEFEPKAGAAERLEALVRVMQSNATATENLGRTIIEHSIGTREDGDGPVPRRGYRRVEWIERALEPARSELGDEEFERLVSALTLLVGWEALLVLRDTRGLTAAQAEEVSAWAAAALLEAGLRA